MNSGNWVLRVVGIAIVVLVALAVSMHTAEYTDKTGACTVKAGTGWKRIVKSEADRSTAALVLAFDATSDSKLPASFIVLIPGGTHPPLAPLPLDEEAQRFADAARKKVPDQRDYGSITTSKLDGEEARVLIFRTFINNVQGIRKEVLAEHNGKLYVVSFCTADDQYARQVAAADALFDSFHWK